MNPTEKQTVQIRFICEDSGRLLMAISVNTLLIPEHALWGRLDYHEAISAIGVGDSMVYRMTARETRALPEKPAITVPRTLLHSDCPIREGALFHLETSNLIARVAQLTEGWANLEFWPAWIRGKSVRLECKVLSREAIPPLEISHFERGFQIDAI